MKVTRRKFLQGSILALATASLAACGEETSTATGGETSTDAGATGGGSDVEQVLNYALLSDPKVMDTTQSNSTTDLICICNSAVQITALQMVDGVLAPQPYGATSWETSEDGLTWTFNLDAVVWEDGQPVTAQHYVDAFKRIVDPALASVQAKTLMSFKNAEKIIAGELEPSMLGVTAVDDSTLQIELDYYLPYFLDLTYGPCFTPVRLDVIEQHGSTYGTEADTLISCGAFKVTEWVHDSHITLTKNEKYYRADEVALDRVEIKIIKDYNSVLAELYSGTIDRSSVSSTEWREKLIETDNFNYGDFTLAGTCTLFFNAGYEDASGNKLLSNSKIRRAIGACIDGQETGDMINGGLAVPAKGLIPITLSIDGVNFREAAGTDPVADLKAEVPDPKALFIEGLKELGLPEDPTAYKINYLVKSTTAASKDNAEYFYEIFKNKIGFEIEIEQVESAVGYDRGKSGEFGMVVSTHYTEYNDPIDLMGMCISTKDSNYALNWNNTTFDDYCNTAAQSRDHDERVKLFADAEKLAVAEDAIIVPIYHPISSMMTAKDVHGFESEAGTFGPSLFRTVYIEEV